MALQIHAPFSLANGLYHRHSIFPKPKFSIKSQKPTVDASDPTPEPPSSSNKPAAPGQGFGSSASSSSTSGKPTVNNVSKKNQKGKKERATIIRRSPVENPVFVSKEEEAKAEEQRKNESAFVLAWLGLGGIILGQGIVLAASGFLPEEWDKFFTKYLYPTFTPTVGLFLAGTTAYGVLKYLENEKLKDQKSHWVDHIKAYTVLLLKASISRLYSSGQETREHLFVRCSYSNYILVTVLRDLDVRVNFNDWDNMLTWLVQKNKGKNLAAAMIKISWCSYIYFVWQKKNLRAHGGAARDKNILLDNIVTIVRDKVNISKFKVPVSRISTA